MRRVIIESPYAGDIPRNILYARRALFHSLRRGEAPLASHLLYTQVLNDGDETERLWGIQAGLEWMDAAEAVVFYTDNGWSAGMLRALSAARVLQKTVELRSLDGKAPAEPPGETIPEAPK